MTSPEIRTEAINIGTEQEDALLKLLQAIEEEETLDEHRELEDKDVAALRRLVKPWYPRAR